MKIESDNIAIEKNIRSLEKIVVEEDGYLNPELVIKCENGALSILRDGISPPKDFLIMLPQSLLFPTEKIGVAVKNDEISTNIEKGTMSAAQQKIAETMIELYNLTNKISDHKKSYAWVSFRACPEALEALLKGRTLNKHDKGLISFTKEKDVSETVMNEFLCDSYLKTRTIGHKEVDTEKNTSALVKKIMPIVDFINHDFSGAPFNFTKDFPQNKRPDEEFLLFFAHRPILDSRECFAFYNQMDAVDAFLNYGFPDAHAPIVRSVPLEIEIPKTGKLIINALHGQWKKGKLAKHVAGLQLFIPQTIRNEKGVIEISHILIPCNNSPQALRRVLRLIISNITPRVLSPEEIWDATLEAEDQIISKTIDFYENLAETCIKKQQKTEDQDAKACWQQVYDLSSLQLTKLYKYTFNSEHYDKKSNTIEQATAA